MYPLGLDTTNTKRRAPLTGDRVPQLVRRRKRTLLGPADLCKKARRVKLQPRGAGNVWTEARRIQAGGLDVVLSVPC